MKRIIAFLFFAAAALAQTGHSSTLTWQDTQNPTGTTYNAWRASGACPATAPTSTPPAGFTLLNTVPIASLTYVDTAVTAGNTYCYVVTAVGPNGQSSPSNDAQAVIPAAFPVQSVSVTVK